MTALLERRLAAEWSTLQQLAAANPDRLQHLAADDLTFSFHLRHTPALPLGGHGAPFVTEHAGRFVFPFFFPAAPLELYLDAPVQHPNIHPLTGFVCLWDRHRLTHTVEHALHRLVAILGWRLVNAEAAHVMQPEALALPSQTREAVRTALAAAPLHGISPSPSSPVLTGPPASSSRRQRLFP